MYLWNDDGPMKIYYIAINLETTKQVPCYNRRFLMDTLNKQTNKQTNKSYINLSIVSFSSQQVLRKY